MENRKTTIQKKKKNTTDIRKEKKNTLDKNSIGVL